MSNRLNQFEMFVEYRKLFFLEENSVVLNENSVEGKLCINIDLMSESS